MKIHTLDTTKPKISGSNYSGLPDESSFTLISGQAAFAMKCGQAFNLEIFDWKRHQRALCVGFTEGVDAIALFYISNAGLYAWIRIDHIHITPGTTSMNFTSSSIENGIVYWFTPSARGDRYFKAEVIGSYSDIGKRYRELHQPSESKTNSPSNKKNNSTDDDGNGAPLSHHPQDDFTLLTSFDEFGL